MWLSPFVILVLQTRGDSFEDHIRDEEPWAFVPKRDNLIRWPATRKTEVRQTKSRFVDINVQFFESMNDAGLRKQAASTCLAITDPMALPPSDLVSDAPVDQCRESLKSGSVVGSSIICGGQLRVPQAQTWDYWRQLDQKEASRFRNAWQTVNWSRLRRTLLDQSDSFLPDGTRKAYLQFELPLEHIYALNRWSAGAVETNMLRLCLLNSSDINNVTDVGTIHPRPAVDVTTASSTTETSMRVFFEPGWRLRKSVRGSNLLLGDRLAVKLNGCEGKMDDRALRVGQAARSRIPQEKVMSSVSRRAVRNVVNSPAIRILEFELLMTPTEEIDTTADWRRAAFFERRALRRASIGANTTTPLIQGTAVRKVRDRRSVSDDSLQMSLCFYSDPTDAMGIPVGSTHFTLASSDAAEFVTLSIFILLGLPVFCMWTVGCLSYRHKKLRVELRRMRLVQQRDQVEARLARYLGFGSKESWDDGSSDEEEESSQLKFDRPTTASGPVVSSSGPVVSTSGPVVSSSGPVGSSSGPVVSSSEPRSCEVATPLLSN